MHADIRTVSIETVDVRTGFFFCPCVTPGNLPYGHDCQFTPSSLHPKGLKCETTLTFLVTGFLSNYQHMFKVNAQLSKFINSPNSKFHADKNYF